MLTDYAAEQAVLGSLILDAKPFAQVATQLSSADFSAEPHRLLYRVLCELHAADQPFDVLLVKRRLEALRTLSSTEIVRLLTELAEGVSTAAHLPQYVTLVREAAQRRTLLQTAERMKQAALAGTPVAQIAADSQTNLDHLLTTDVSRSALGVLSAGAEGAGLSRPQSSGACWQPFPTEVLPAGLADYVRAEAQATVVDESMVALPLLVALASAIGGARQAGVKRGWYEPCILWGALVAPASSGKTPAAKNVLKIVRDRDQQALAETRSRLTEYHLLRAAYEREVKKTGGSGLPCPERPPQPRFHLQDATPEQLLSVLEDNPRGVLVVRDELSGLFGGFGRSAEGRGMMERSRYLSIWCAEHLSDDRKTTRSLYVRRPHASLYGGVQPELLFRCLGDDDVAAGLPARFLFAWPPEQPRVWSETVVPSKLLRHLQTVFDQLYALPMKALTNHEAPGEAAPGSDNSVPGETLYFTPEARDHFANWYTATHARQLDATSGALRAAWGKLPGYVARLALVLQLAHWAEGQAPGAEIDLPRLKLALTLTDWFAAEAARVYRLQHEDHNERDLRRLREHVYRRGGRMTARQVRANVRPFRTMLAAEQALNRLVEQGDGHWQTIAGEQVFTLGQPKVASAKAA